MADDCAELARLISAGPETCRGVGLGALAVHLASLPRAEREFELLRLMMELARTCRELGHFVPDLPANLMPV